MNSMIIAAAGQGERFGAPQNKLLENIGGKPLIWYTLHHVMQSLLLDEVILVTSPEERRFFQQIAEDVGGTIAIRYADGGATRTDSVYHGMQALSADSEVVLIHDGARPWVDGAAVDQLIKELQKGTPAALYCVPCIDTIKYTDGNGRVCRTPDRKRLMRAQTPQGIQTSIFRRCMETVRRDHLSVTDDVSVCEVCGIPVKYLMGKEAYFKVTVPEDKQHLLDLIQKDSLPFRIGQGYDIHRVAAERPLVLGGVHISDTGGLLGHSDADVLIHAVMDALLGAAGCADIGQYFPDQDDRYLNISSMILLKKVRKIITEKGYGIGNIDATIIAEAPKMAPHIPAMRQNMADALHILPEEINIKATTNEILGAVGRREGIAALASVLLFRRRL